MGRLGVELIVLLEVSEFVLPDVVELVVAATGFVTTALTGASGISGTPKAVVTRGVVVGAGLVTGGVGTGWLEGTG